MKARTYHKPTPEFLAAIKAANWEEVWKRGQRKMARMIVEVSENSCAVTAQDRSNFEQLARTIGYTGELFAVMAVER